MAITRYTIHTTTGKIMGGDSLNILLSAAQLTEFDTIGYSGKSTTGKKIAREEFLNSLNIGDFKVTQLKHDSGDFVETFSIIHLYDVIPIKTTKVEFESFIEDGGIAKIATLTGQDKNLFVSLPSWDETNKHINFAKFKGQKVKVTIEVMK